ncbi:MAG: hypothetical protein HEQ32_08525 [Vampirovibrio sp.]
MNPPADANPPLNPDALPLQAFCRPAVWDELERINQLLPLHQTPMAKSQNPLAWEARRQAVVQERALIYARLQADADYAELLQRACRHDILLWFRYFAWTFDPRPEPNSPEKASRRSIGKLPLVLFPFQMEAVLRMNDAIERGEDLLIEKSRDMGLSWLLCLVFQYRWMFKANQQFLVGSRNYASADTKHDLATLMEKCRFNLREQPDAMRPVGFDWRKHDVGGKLVNPQNGNLIMPEAATENFARGGRYTAILMDEFAFWPMADGAYSAAGQSSLCRLVVSTPNGKHNRFALERFSGLTSVMTLHWSLHPFKDQYWYNAQKNRLLKHEIARELDISYEHSNRDKVFEEFTPKHKAALTYNADLPVHRIWDFGYHAPAVLAMQRDVWGRIVILKEWVGERVVLRHFATQVLKDCDALFGEGARFKDFCDPAGHQHNDKSEHTSIEVLEALGVYPTGVRCGINESIDKVRHLMIEERDVLPTASSGGATVEGLEASTSRVPALPLVMKTPAFLVDDTACPILVHALEGGYRYKSADSEELAQEHPYEDVADCLRYGVWILGKLLMESSDWSREERKRRYQREVALARSRRHQRRPFY